MSALNFRWFPLLALIVTACHYDPAVPEGAVKCRVPQDCPGGYRCLPKPGGEGSFCCRNGCGFSTEPTDGAAPERKLDAPASKPDLASDRGGSGGQGGEPDASPDLALTDGPVDAPEDGPTLAPPDGGPDLSPDLSPDTGPPCPASRGGPALVRAGGFCIDANEVTNRQYLEFLSAKGTDMSGQPTACKWNTSYVPSTEDLIWPYLQGRDDYPVANVDWCDAYMFCSWAGKRLCGKIGGGRLPSVDSSTAPSAGQWMHACSGGGRVSYPYGNTFNKSVCNTDAPTKAAMYVEEVRHRPACQGGYPGLYDLGGNLEEWIDACDKDTGATDLCGIAGSTSFTGGLFPDDLTCSGSIFGEARNVRYYLLGFRCCAD
jgi:hypothetical protein